MSELDDRLRAALGDLGEATQRQIRPPGADAVPAAGRRRRRAALAAIAALTLVLAGGVATGWWLVGTPAPFHRSRPAAAPVCLPAAGSAFLPDDTSDALRGQVGNLLGRTPQVTDYHYESKQQAYERFKEQFRDAPDLVAATRPDSLPASWRFTLRCAADFPTVQERLTWAVPGVDVLCTCGAHIPDKSTVPGDVRSGPSN